MGRGTLVTVTGVDGTGKSTLVENVTAALREAGYDAVPAYGRYLTRLAGPVMELGRRTLLSDTDFETDYADNREAKETYYARGLLSAGYEALLVADYLPQVYWRVARRLYAHDYVICDRYLCDTVLNDLPIPGEDVGATLRAYDRYARLVPAPDLEFYVSVPPSVSVERKDDIPAIEYVTDRKRRYDAFARARGMTVLDGTRPPSALTRAVLDRVLPESCSSS